MHSIGIDGRSSTGFRLPVLNTIDAGENALHIVIHLLQFCFLTQYTGLRTFQSKYHNFIIKTDNLPQVCQLLSEVSGLLSPPSQLSPHLLGI